MKKVLIITYYWPPAGGPGVQRVLKFAKYLPEFGWQPIILTVQDGEYPAYDESLQNDVPSECKVYRTRSPEPFKLYKKFIGAKKSETIPIATLSEKGLTWKKRFSNWIRLNFFIPDAKIGWLPYAVRKGKEIIDQEKPDLILSSSPPPTVHLIARKLAKWSKLKWIADFRDPWTKIHYYSSGINCISRKIDQKLEKKVIKDCDNAICASYSFVDLLTEIHSEKFITITNGYDLKLKEKAHRKSAKTRIVYTGGLTSNRVYANFFVDLGYLLNEVKTYENSIELLLVGKINPEIRSELEKFVDNDKVLKIINYVDHEKAVQYMREADILLLFLEKKKNYKGHIPAKLFEYLTTGNFILGIGPEEGDAARIMKETGTGGFYTAESDFKEIWKLIAERTEVFRSDNVNWDEIKKYSRRNLTEQLALFFDKSIG